MKTPEKGFFDIFIIKNYDLSDSIFYFRGCTWILFSMEKFQEKL
jgi:hypothetical protein